VATTVAAPPNGDAERAQQRAVALCWLLHLAGDAHQPLHAISYFSGRYPKGDKGGNLQYVRPDAQGRPVNLHSLWDGLVIGSQRLRVVQQEATRLREQFPASGLPEVTVLDPVVWTQHESYPLAKTEAYLNRSLRTSTDENRAPALPVGYLANAKQVAERRIALAGHRMSGLLGQLLVSP